MQDTSLSFQFLVENNQLLIKLQDAQSIPSIKDIQAEFADSEYQHWFVESEVETFLEQQKSNFQQGTSCVLATRRDAELKITVSPDKLQITAEITPSYGGLDMSLGQIKQECVNQNIKFGLKSSLTNKLLEQSKTDSSDVISRVIGQGKAAVNGDDAYLVPLVPLLSEKARAPQQKDDGGFDLRDLGSILSIAKGATIAEKVPPTKGIPGMDVFGEYLEASDGQDFELKSSNSVEVSTENPNQLIAKVEGIPRLRGNQMEIDNVFTVEELNPKQGHIKFNGSVIVQGDVYPDMKIEAKGDVVIGGFVESSNIRAHGDITVLGGVSGKIVEEDGTKSFSCRLTSAGTIDVSFANQCQITAKKLVNAKKQLSHCEVTAYSVRAGSVSKVDGQVIGGTYRLCKTLEIGRASCRERVCMFV